MIKRIILLFILLLFCVTSSQANQVDRRIILDTDISSDADDVGAMAVLHGLAREESIEILAIMVSSSDPWSPQAVYAINKYFGKPEIPIGVVPQDGVAHKSSYSRALAEIEPAQVFSGRPSVDLYRKILANQPDKSVTIVTIGYLTNLRDLLISKADQYSPLSGLELVDQKVRLLVTMGGDYPQGKEWNFIQDPEASKRAVENWPTKIIFVGYTLGLNILTGQTLQKAEESCPIRLAYQLHNNFSGRPSWDQLAVLYALLTDRKRDELFTVSTPGQNTIQADGSNVWNEKSDGVHHVLGLRADLDQVAERIENLMTNR